MPDAPSAERVAHIRSLIERDVPLTGEEERDLLAALDAAEAARSTARREALEAATMAVCTGCRGGHMLRNGAHIRADGVRIQCRAVKLRAAAEAG